MIERVPSWVEIKECCCRRTRRNSIAPTQRRVLSRKHTRGRAARSARARGAAKLELQRYPARRGRFSQPAYRRHRVSCDARRGAAPEFRGGLAAAGGYSSPRNQPGSPLNELLAAATPPLGQIKCIIQVALGPGEIKGVGRNAASAVGDPATAGEPAVHGATDAVQPSAAGVQEADPATIPRTGSSSTASNWQGR